MSIKKIVTIVLTVVLGLLLIPVVFFPVIIAIGLWKIGLKKSDLHYKNGVKVYCSNSLSDKYLHVSMKISSFGMQRLDFSVSPAMAVPRYGYVLLRAELMAKYSYLAQQFILIHELGHLQDPLMRKPGAGLGIEGEYRADAFAVKQMALTVTQLREIYDELITNITAGMKTAEARVIEDVMIRRLVNAIKVSQETMPRRATFTAKER